MTIAPSRTPGGQPAYLQRQAADPRPRPATGTVPGRRGRTLLGYLAVPRPKDMFKALLMPLTFGVGVLANGGTTGDTVLRAIVVLAALELLVYPARYQWNDVRGFVADQHHPGEADRGRLPGPLDRGREHVVASCVVAAARIAATAALPLLLPGWQLAGILTWVVVGVFGVAIAYEALRAAGTGRTGQVPAPLRPTLVLLWITVGAGYVVRGLTGLALAVDLRERPALGVAAAVTLWAYGIAFVTSRWAVEATAFARLAGGRVTWSARASQAREHLLGLVRWLPRHAEAGHGRADGPAAGWRPLRRRTSLLAPWNLAAVVAGTAAALTGRLLAGPAPVADAVLVAALGGVAALVVAAAPRCRAVAVAGGGAALLGVLLLRGAPGPGTALLPWVAVSAAFAYATGQSLATMGKAGSRLRAGLRALLKPVARAAIGRDTWDLLVAGDSARG